MIFCVLSYFIYTYLGRKQERTDHIRRWDFSNGAPLVWGPPTIMTFFFLVSNPGFVSDIFRIFLERGSQTISYLVPFFSVLLLFWGLEKDLVSQSVPDHVDPKKDLSTSSTAPCQVSE
jgi:hypothetical protein